MKNFDECSQGATSLLTKETTVTEAASRRRDTAINKKKIQVESTENLAPDAEANTIPDNDADGRIRPIDLEIASILLQFAIELVQEERDKDIQQRASTNAIEHKAA